MVRSLMPWLAAHRTTRCSLSRRRIRFSSAIERAMFLLRSMTITRGRSERGTFFRRTIRLMLAHPASAGPAQAIRSGADSGAWTRDSVLVRRKTCGGEPRATSAISSSADESARERSLGMHCSICSALSRSIGLRSTPSRLDTLIHSQVSGTARRPDLTCCS